MTAVFLRATATHVRCEYAAYDEQMAHALVIDTCGATGYVAVIATEPVTPAALSERHLAVRATQEELQPAVHAVLAEAGVALRDVAAVAVVHGPGSFTGVRIGLAAAKGLCEAAGVPLVTLSRLEVLADASRARPVWAWLQAGRGDVYAVRFGADAEDGKDEAAVATDASRSKGDVLTLERALAAAGEDGIGVCEEELRAAAPRSIFVSAHEFEGALRRAAAVAVRDARWSDVALSDALYLRVPDAELALRAKQG